MEQNLKKVLNDKMDALSAKDMASHFDKEQTWDELAARLGTPEHQIRPFAGRWAYAAAALLIGLIVGGLAVRFYEHTTPVSVLNSPVAVNLPAKSADVSSPKSDSLMPIQNAPGYAASGTAHSIQQRANLHPTQHFLPSADSLPININIEERPSQTLQPTKDQRIAGLPQVNTKPAQVLRAIHLLDVESEDRIVLLNNAERIYPGLSFAFYISPKRLPDGRDAGAPLSVLGPIIH